MQQRGANEQQRSKIKIVAQRTFLIIYHRVRLTLSVLHRIAIGIDHRCTSIAGCQQQAFQGSFANGQGHRFHHHQHIGSNGFLSD